MNTRSPWSLLALVGASLRAYAARGPSCVSLLVCAIVFLRSGTAIATDVTVERIDGTHLEGTWIGSTDGRAIELRLSERVETIPLDDLAAVRFAFPKSIHPSNAVPAAADSADQESARAGDSQGKRLAVVFHLADGGRLYGLVLDPVPGTDALIGRTPLGEALPLPFDRLAAVQLAEDAAFPRSAEVFRSALSRRRPGQDLLITRGSENVKTLRGRLDSMGPSRGSFAFGERPRSFQTAKIFGVVFAAGAAGPEPDRYTVTVSLQDGSLFSGELEHADDTSIRIATSLGFTARLGLLQLTGLRVHSDRVVYASDLEPVERRVEGILHRPWPIHLDRNVADGPLELGGRRFDKGLGVHSHTGLVYAIDTRFEKFAATIGVDDAVRPRGSVVFRVLGDDRVLFESAELTGRSPPKDVVVNVSDVKRLTLLVDFGAGLDLSDYADWGNARLIKPPTPDSAANPQ